MYLILKIILFLIYLTMQTPKQTFVTTLLELDFDSTSTKQLYKKIRQAYYDYTMMATDKYWLDNIIYYYMTEDEAMEWLSDQMRNCNTIYEVYDMIDVAITNDWVFYVNDDLWYLISAEKEDMEALVDAIIIELSK